MFFIQYPGTESSLSYFSVRHFEQSWLVAGDEDWFAEEARKANVRITHVIDPHVHADHWFPKDCKHLGFFRRAPFNETTSRSTRLLTNDS